MRPFERGPCAPHLTAAFSGRTHLLSTGLLVSDTRLGPVRLGLPLDALQFLFPSLYPEAAQAE